MIGLTTEEKLQHFYEVSVENAKEEAEQAVREYEQVLEASLEEHRQAKKRQMEMELQAETENAKRQMNKALSAEQLRIKRRLSRTQDHLKEKLFVRVAEKLQEFRKTPEYVAYLESWIQKARKFAGRYPISRPVTVEGEVNTLYLSHEEAQVTLGEELDAGRSRSWRPR